MAAINFNKIGFKYVLRFTFSLQQYEIMSTIDIYWLPQKFIDIAQIIYGLFTISRAGLSFLLRRAWGWNCQTGSIIG